MWAEYLNEYLIKTKNHVINKTKLVLFIYIINSTYTVHSWPFNEVQCNNWLKGFCEKLYPLKYYITMICE